MSTSDITTDSAAERAARQAAAQSQHLGGGGCRARADGPEPCDQPEPAGPALHVGRAVPLVFLLSLIGVMLVAYGFIRLCQSFHHAGSVYAFIGVTVGPRAGFVAGWTLFLDIPRLTATSVAAFGLFIQQFCIDTGIWKGASWVLFSFVDTW